jgi:hypothetical protein
MKIKVTKTYKGLVEVRNYDVKKCIENNEPMIISYAGESMELSPEELDSDVRSISKEFPSKMGGKPYKLYGYEWNPDM